MRRLLRSVMTSASSDKADLHLKNFFVLQKAGLDYPTSEYDGIWTYTQDFVRAHSHVPDFETLRDHFKSQSATSTIDQLEVIKTMKPLLQGNFITAVESKAHDRRTRLSKEILADAHTILTQGMELPTGRRHETKIYRGPRDMFRHIMARAPEVVKATLGARTSGEITGDMEDFKEEYLRAEQEDIVGRYTGIKQIDEEIQGAKAGELWTHAAFTSHGKSMFALNWMYNQSIFMRYSTLYFSLEMPYEQIRRIVVAMHSYHPKFRDVRIALKMQQDPDIHTSLQYRYIRYGTLEEHERDFLLEYVIQDLANPANNYGKMHIECVDPDHTETTVGDIRSRSELVYSHDPFDLLVIDHAGLIHAKRWVASTSERGNEVMRDLKILSGVFNNGQGVPVVALFQINRKGYEYALANNGEYLLTHLAYVNEVEKSSDIVTTTWLHEDDKKANQIWFQCLKNRDGRFFDRFAARVEWACRRILTRINRMAQQQKASRDKLPDNVSLEALLGDANVQIASSN